MGATALTVSLAALGYGIGSIPTGVWLARWKGLPDPRSAGSGNIGATNVARTLGKRMGIVTLVGDMAKGLIPVLLGRAALLPIVPLAVVAAATVFGHVFSAFLRFQGGKGVATGLGAFLGLSPAASLAALAVFAAVFAATRWVSLSSVLATVALPVAMAFAPATRSAAPLVGAVSALIVWKHRANLARLARGEEPRFGAARDAAAAEPGGSEGA